MKINPDDQKEDYESFGRIVLLWGHVEASLAGIILSLMHPLHGIPYDKGVEHDFGSKCQQARRGYRDIQRLAPICQRATAAINALGKLHQKRSIIVHGYYQGFTGHGYYAFDGYETRSGHKKRWRSFAFKPAEIATLTLEMARYRKIMTDLQSETFRLMHS